MSPAGHRPIALLAAATVLVGLSSAVRAATVTVVAENFRFAPAQRSVAAGDAVQWTFTGEPHTVTSGAPGSPDGRFDSGIVQAGGTFAQRFDAPGTYPYFCAIHPEDMVGSIVVAAAATPAPTRPPTPRPTPRPTPPPTPRPGATAAPAATPRAAVSAEPTATLTPAAEATPSPAAGTTSTPSATGRPTSAATPTPAPGASSAPGPSSTSANPEPAAAGSGDLDPGLALLALLVGAVAAGSLAAARRRSKRG